MSTKKLRLFQCSICSQNILLAILTKKHVNMVHKNIKLFKCKICSKVFGSNCQISQSFIQFTNMYNKKLQELLFNIPRIQFTKYVTKKHVNMVHKKIKLFKCKICSKVFSHYFQISYSSISFKNMLKKLNKTFFSFLF